jgi:hypothetical protein
MLANQYLIFEDPRDALEVAEPIPAACRAIEASSTDERRAALSEQLENILSNMRSGWPNGGATRAPS